MKKSKRLISLILAVVMVLSFMAMSASAATTEIQPRGAACETCGSSNTRTVDYGFIKMKSIWQRNGCSEYPAVGHYHTTYSHKYEFICNSCGANYFYYTSTYVACES